MAGNPVHPLLARLDAERAGQTEVEEEASTQTEEVQTEEVQEDSTVGTEQEEEFYRIPKGKGKETHKALQDLIGSDQDFRNIFNTAVGRKAKAEYQPEIEKLKTAIAERDWKEVQTLKQSVPAEKLGEALKDPNFAKVYHQEAPNPAQLRVYQEFQSAVEEVFTDVSDELNEDEEKQFREALLDQYYDVRRDRDGNVVSDLSGNPVKITPTQSIVALTNSINQYLRDKTSVIKQAPAAKAPPSVEKKAPVANPKLAVTPDLSPPSGGKGGMGRMSVEEYKRLDPRQRIKLFPTQDDYVKARETGLIYDSR